MRFLSPCSMGIDPRSGSVMWFPVCGVFRLRLLYFSSKILYLAPPGLDQRLIKSVQILQLILGIDGTTLAHIDLPPTTSIDYNRNHHRTQVWRVLSLAPPRTHTRSVIFRKIFILKSFNFWKLFFDKKYISRKKHSTRGVSSVVVDITWIGMILPTWN